METVTVKMENQNKDNEKKVDSKASKNELYMRLAVSKVFVPINASDKGFSLGVLKTPNGETYIPAFIGEDSDIGSFEKESIIEIPFNDLRNIIIELRDNLTGIVMEPFGKAIAIKMEELTVYDAVTKGMTVVRNDHVGKVKMMKASHLPEGLRDAVKDFAAGRIDIDNIWIVLTKNENAYAAHLTFVIECYGNKLEVFPKLAETVKPFMMPGQSFELLEKTEQMDMSEFSDGLAFSQVSKGLS